MKPGQPKGLRLRQDIRVLFVIGQLQKGGAERQLYYLLSQMRQPATVLVLSRGGYWAPHIRELGHEVIELERRGRLEFARLLVTMKIFKQKKPDIVHLFCDGIEGLYARLAALLTRQPHFVVGVRITPDFYPAWHRLLQFYLNRTAKALVCNSWSAVDYLKNHRLARRDSVYYIPNCIDLPGFADRGDRAEQEASGQNLVVGTVASLTHKKNPELFLKAAARVHALLPNAQFWILGDGYLRAQCEALIEEAGLQTVVRLHGESDRVPHYLSRMDLFVLTSRYEGTPNAFLEAMAARLPCVLTDVGDVDRMASESGSALVVPSEDLDGLVSAITTLLQDSGLRQKMGRAGYDYVLRVHGPTDVAQRYITLYDRLTSGREVTQNDLVAASLQPAASAM